MFLALNFHCWRFLYLYDGSQGCHQTAKALSMHPTAVLGGLLTLVTIAMSHASVNVPGTNWVESVLLWVAIGMPTGSGKTPLYKYLTTLLRKMREACSASKDPS